MKYGDLNQRMSWNILPALTLFQNHLNISLFSNKNFTGSLTAFLQLSFHVSCCPLGQPEMWWNKRISQISLKLRQLINTCNTSIIVNQNKNDTIEVVIPSWQVSHTTALSSTMFTPEAELIYYQIHYTHTQNISQLLNNPETFCLRSCDGLTWPMCSMNAQWGNPIRFVLKIIEWTLDWYMLRWVCLIMLLRVSVKSALCLAGQVERQ